MSEINFQSKGKKSYVVKLDDTAIGRLVKTSQLPRPEGRGLKKPLVD